MTRADKFVVLVALLTVSWSYYWAWQPVVAGEQVEIYQGNTLFERHALSEHVTLNVPGNLGDSVIEIADGRARFQSSPCTGKFCIHTGWQQHGGDVTACLPNGISLQITGGQGRFDALAF